MNAIDKYRFPKFSIVPARYSITVSAQDANGPWVLGEIFFSAARGLFFSPHKSREGDDQANLLVAQWMDQHKDHLLATIATMYGVRDREVLEAIALERAVVPPLLVLPVRRSPDAFDGTNALAIHWTAALQKRIYQRAELCREHCIEEVRDTLLFADMDDVDPDALGEGALIRSEPSAIGIDPIVGMANLVGQLVVDKTQWWLSVRVGTENVTVETDPVAVDNGVAELPLRKSLSEILEPATPKGRPGP